MDIVTDATVCSRAATLNKSLLWYKISLDEMGEKKNSNGSSLLILNKDEVDEEQIHALLHRERDYYFLSASRRSIVKRYTSSNRHISWRPKIIEWFYKIVDYFDYNRDVVATALDLLDRFDLFSNDEDLDAEKYQLTAMASLYVAIKTNSLTSDSRRLFSLDEFAKLSRDQFTAQDLLSMEMKLFNTLDWKVNPVIPTDYLVSLLCLFRCCSYKQTTTLRIQSTESEGNMQYVFRVLYEVARYLIEVALISPEINFYLDSVKDHQSPSLLCLGAIAQTLNWVSHNGIPLILKRNFISRSSSLLQVESVALNNVKKLIQKSLLPSTILDGQFSPEEILEEVDNLHPFVLLQRANLLCPFARRSFITSISQGNNDRKRKYPHSPTSILDDEDQH